MDGEFLPAHPATLVREGRYNRVDVLSGVTRDEGAFNARGEGRRLAPSSQPQIPFQSFIKTSFPRICCTAFRHLAVEL